MKCCMKHDKMNFSATYEKSVLILRLSNDVFNILLAENMVENPQSRRCQPHTLYSKFEIIRYMKNKVTLYNSAIVNFKLAMIVLTLEVATQFLKEVVRLF